jgi:DNA-binding NarL/FixJ family response regulator
VVREGLAKLLDRRPGFEVVATAGTREEAIALARRFAPDIVLMDLRLPDGSGVDACRSIHDENPAIAVVFLTSSPEDADVYAAVLAGARGYVLKQTPTAELLRALAGVARGDTLLDRSVTSGILERIRRIAAGVEDGPKLTERERQILRLLVEGDTNIEIANAIFLSPATVKNYVSSILDKLGVERRTQVIDLVSRNAELLD